MDAEKETGSATPILESTETDNAQPDQDRSQVLDEEWRSMKTILDTLYDHRDSSGHDPSKIFHRKVNKRLIPDYYDVIAEPIALSTLKAKLSTREYKSFEEFVRDATLISHNAQTYNRPEAQAFLDALTLKGLLESTLKRLASEGSIKPEQAVLPDLGEIPAADPAPVEEEEEDDEDDEDDDEDDEPDDSDEEGGRKKRRRGRPIGSLKREGMSKDDAALKGDADSRKKRGRPPRVDTPMEARIKAVLKGIRKPKNDLGQIMIHHFEKLPDKATMPEYFAEIKEPIAIELIKRKQKRKKYQSVDHFMRDIDTMFNNAKMYNQDESQIYKDAVFLQKEAQKLAEQEKKKPDAEYVMEEGRLPLPNGILHNGELWKVGDWVHIQNPNDVTKPIVAQIYRTWQDNEGQEWVNACWYYRPEQTVHQFEKHFYPNEVVKTGQYRDHHIDEIVDRCFVMFFTRYSRGRPRHFPVDKEVYVCEARYNEEKHKLNKIKTWASCLPDEVRDKDYEMDLFDGLRKVKKVESPLLHMLKEDAKDSDELPKPRWGVENAPPIVGNIHKGPRDENQSPPPEPTPSPPPQPPPPPPRQISNLSANGTPGYRRNSELDSPNMRNTAGPQIQSSTTPLPANNAPSSYSQQQPRQYSQQSASPAPVPHTQYGQQSSTYQPQSTHSSHNQSQPANVDHYSAPQSRYPQYPPTNRSAPHVGTNVNAPRSIEAYHLSDSANLSIPEDIREQFHRDEQGRVLFFSAPPLDVLPPMKKGAALGHSLKYRAEKIRRAEMQKKKAETENVQKEARKRKRESEMQKPRAFMLIAEERLREEVKEIEQGTDQVYEAEYGDLWQEAKHTGLENVKSMQRSHERARIEVEERAKKMRERGAVSLKKGGVFLDDVDPRY